MKRDEFELLLTLLRKFHHVSGEKILDVEIKIVDFMQSTPLFKVRDGVFMDDKMAYEYDKATFEENYARSEERERNDRHRY